MPRIRPVRTLSAALLGTAVLWAAGVSDPAWAEAAGVDVWNIGRLETELREADAVGQRWRERGERLAVRYQVNDLMLDDLIAGRRSLAASAVLMWEENRSEDGYRITVETSCVGPSVEAQSAHNLLQRAACRMRSEPAAVRQPTLARLRAEYEQVYGVPAPAVQDWGSG